MALPRSPVTQSLTNSYPEWSDVRNDEQSLGAGILNVVGIHLQDLHEQIQTVGKNYFVSTANTKDIDLVYRLELPNTFEFSNLGGNEEYPDLQPPTVEGLIGITWYPVTMATENNLESFWYDSIPNRFTFESFDISSDNAELDASLTPWPGLLINITQEDSPYTPSIEGLVVDDPGTKLWIEVTGGTNYIAIDDMGKARRAMITLTGITRKDMEETETLIFLHDDIVATSKEWKVIKKVEAQNINPSNASIRIWSYRFGSPDPVLPPKLDWYNLAVANSTKQKIDTFWKVNFVSSTPVLEMIQHVNEDIRDRIIGLVDKEVKRTFTLYKTDGTTLLDTPVDLSIEPFSNKIWVITEDKHLYLFNNELPASNGSLLKKKNFQASAVIEPETYHVGILNESVDINYIWRRPIIDIIRHRVFVDSPNGTRYSVNGGLNAYTPNDWIYTTLDNRRLREPDSIVLNQRGDWVWTLETVYSNGVSEIDQRVISVEDKTALLDLDLTSITTGSIVGLDFDSDQTLWVATLELSTALLKHKINFYSDKMLVDFDKKILFFKERYDQVKVIL